MQNSIKRRPYTSVVLHEIKAEKFVFVIQRKQNYVFVIQRKQNTSGIRWQICLCNTEETDTWNS